MSKKSTVNYINSKCDSCFWFLEPQGESEVTCKDRGVHKNSKACKDYTLKPFDTNFIKANDKFLIKIKEKLSSSRFTIDKSVNTELTSYFILGNSFKEGGDYLKQIPVCSYGPKEASSLLSLFEKTQSLRDRTLSIKLGIFSIRTELKSIETVGKQYIFENYGKYLNEMKTEAIRSMSINSLLSPLAVKILEVEDLIEKANLIYENLKDTYFTLKEIKDIACAFLTSTRMSV